MWDDLTKTALVGTDKAPITITNPTGTLKRVNSAIAGRDDESTLLALAGAATLQTMAGYIARETTAQLPVQADADERPVCSATAVQQLALRLLERDFRLMEEWVHLCNHSGQRIMEKYIPALLENMRSKPELSAALCNITGRRGAWLAQFQPAWQPIFTTKTESDWFAEGLPLETRLKTLRTRREQDATAARASLMQHIHSFDASDRAALVGVLAVNLSINDEDTLETLLKDKSKQVNGAAASLLAMLTDSHYVARMIDYAKNRVTINPAHNKKPLDVQFYTSPGREMERDGLRRPFDRALDEQTKWFTNIISAIPLAYWEQLTGADARTLMTLAVNTSDKKVMYTLFFGWEQAAIHYGRTDWMAIALELRLQHALLNMTMNRRLLVGPSVYTLASHFPAADVEAMVVTAFASKKRNAYLPLVCRHNWSHNFSIAALRFLADLTKNDQQIYIVSSVLVEAAYVCHPDVLSSVAGIFPHRDGKGHIPSTFNRAVESFTGVLKRRRDMWEAFCHDG